MVSLGRGIYSLPEASRFADISPISARRWFLGRSDSKSGAVLRPDYPIVGSTPAISFLDLVDLAVVGRFRERDVPLQTVRRVYRSLCQRFQSVHPFSQQRLLTDGKRIFIEIMTQVGDPILMEALSGQRAFPEVLHRYLHEIVYDTESGFAKLWRIGKGIVLDPTRNFGKPMLDKFGISTRVLAAAYLANERNAELVADLYGVTPDAVLDAESFERERAAA